MRTITTWAAKARMAARRSGTAVIKRGPFSDQNYARGFIEGVTFVNDSAISVRRGPDWDESDPNPFLHGWYVELEDADEPQPAEARTAGDAPPGSDRADGGGAGPGLAPVGTAVP